MRVARRRRATTIDASSFDELDVFTGKPVVADPPSQGARIALIQVSRAKTRTRTAQQARERQIGATFRSWERHYAREMTPELGQLLSQLDRLRTGVLTKLVGLSEADARCILVGSGTNLAGLVQHLTFVESKWFQEIAAGGSARGDRSMQVDPSVSLRTLRANYRAACEASDDIIRSLGDADAPVAVKGNSRNLRSAILAVIEETARHAGHADIIREQIDGQTGR